MTKQDAGLRPLFTKHLPQVDWCPIESHMNGGVPDMNGCYQGTEFWIEFKQTKQRNGKIKFRPLQPGWINRRVRNGGHVWVAIRHQPPGSGRDDLHLIHGTHVVDLVRVGLSRVPAAGGWGDGPTNWDWSSVLYCLIRGGALK
jgi:hypothetical protein